MTTAQEAFNARKEAVDHLEKLLQTPDSLRNLDILIDDSSRQRATNGELLTAALVSHVSDLRSGIESLERAKEALTAFQTRFSSIEALCEECVSLVEAKDDIRRLGAVHSNVRHTLQSAETVATLPKQAADAEKMLSQNSSQGVAHHVGMHFPSESNENTLKAYLALAELEATVVRVQQALHAFKSQQSTAHIQVPALDFYFTQVHRAMGKVEDRIWSTIRSFRSVSRTTPAALVAALQVIEIQEMVDRELLVTGQGGSGLRKGWRNKCMQQLTASIQESFAPLLQKCSKLMAEDAPVEELLFQVLDESKTYVGELHTVRDYVVPCFPPHYMVLDVVAMESHNQVGAVLDLVGLCAHRLSNGDIIHCMKWVDDYQNTVERVLTETTTPSHATALSVSAITGVGLLLEKYVDRVATTLESWLTNIVENDFIKEPSISQQGRLWTPGPVDLFRILDEQLSVAAPAGGVLVSRIAMEASRMLYSFQSSTKAKLEGKRHAIEVLCAIANNSQRCIELGLEFVTRATELLGKYNDDDHGGGDSKSSTTKVQRPLKAGGGTVGRTGTSGGEGGREARLKPERELRKACMEFSTVGTCALTACIDSVFYDPGFHELFSKVGCSDGWRTGTVTGSILATLEDFMSDFETWLLPELDQKLVQLLMAETVAHMLAAILMQLKSVTEDELRALKRDVSNIQSFFGDKGRKECQALLDVVDFLASDSVESFVLSYSSLLETAPGISPVLMTHLINARVGSDEEMTKADGKEIMDACRVVYNEKKEALMTTMTDSNGDAASTISNASTANSKNNSNVQRHGGGMGMLMMAGGRDVAFMAALNAARHRRFSEKNNIEI